MYFSIAAIIAATGCQDDILIKPETMIGDYYSNHYLSYLADGNYNTYWRAGEEGEYVYFYFTEEVEVKWIFIQRYSTWGTYVKIWDGSTTFAHEYFGDSSENYDTLTLRFNGVQTDMLRFYFYWSSSLPAISRLEVYGCYNTSTPTTSPTTRVPTDNPTAFPSVSPTLPPLSAPLSKKPTTLPTAAPTESPSTATVSPYPSLHPSWSPTVPPSIGTVKPSPSPSFSPTMTMQTYNPSVAPSASPTSEPSIVLSALPSITPSSSPTEPPTVVVVDAGGFHITLGSIEFFLIVLSCLCGVIFFLLLRYRKAMQVNGILHNTAERAKQSGNASHKAQDNVMQFENTRYKVSDNMIRISDARDTPGDSKTQNNETCNVAGEDKKIEPRDHHNDIHFTLDKVLSDNDEVFNTKGDLEIGPQDSAL